MVSTALWTPPLGVLWIYGGDLTVEMTKMQISGTIWYNSNRNHSGKRSRPYMSNLGHFTSLPAHHKASLRQGRAERGNLSVVRI